MELFGTEIGRKKESCARRGTIGGKIKIIIGELIKKWKVVGGNRAMAGNGRFWQGKWRIKKPAKVQAVFRSDASGRERWITSPFLAVTP
jgi:hypothetical protein